MQHPLNLGLPLLLFLLVSCSNSDPRGTTEPREDTVTPEFSTPATPPQPLPVQTMPPEPVRDPNRPQEELTLIEVATGRAFPLSHHPDERIWSRPSFSAGGRVLVYASRVGDTQTLYRVDLSNPTPTPRAIGEGGWPVISPDARMVAYTDSGLFIGPLVVIDATGQTHALAPYAYAPSWSPDSRWLAYRSVEKTTDRNREVLVDTRTWTQTSIAESIIAGGDAVHLASWSADSRYVSVPSTSNSLFALSGAAVPFVEHGVVWHPQSASFLILEELQPATPNTPAQRRLSLYDITTGHNLVLAEGSIGEPQWSPQGNYVSFSSAVGTQIIRPAGEPVGTVDGYVQEWSADEQFLLGFNLPGCEWQVGRLDGSRVRCLRFDNRPTWAPTGSILGFLTSEQHGPHPASPESFTSNRIFLLDAATNNVSVLLDSVYSFEPCLSWSPDGRYLLVHACVL